MYYLRTRNESIWDDVNLDDFVINQGDGGFDPIIIVNSLFFVHKFTKYK